MHNFNNKHILIRQLIIVVVLLCCKCTLAAPKPDTVRSPDLRHNIFIKIVASKNKVYTGEPFVVQYVLYAADKINDPQNELDIKLKDCDLEAYPDTENAKTQLKNGREFRVMTVKKLLVIPQPQLKGAVQIPAISIDLNVILPPKKDDFLETEQTVSAKITSGTRAVAILPVPPNKGDIQFSGAVGQFKIACEYISSAKNSNILTVRFSVTGTGNLKYVNWPVPVIPPGVDIYNMAHHEAHQLTANGIAISHVFSFDLSSNYRGVFSINPISFRYFNPATGQYVNFLSAPYKWKTGSGSPLPPNLTAVNASAQNVSGLSLNIKNDLGSAWFYGVVLGPAFYRLAAAASAIFILMGMVVIRYRKARENSLPARNFMSAEKRAIKSIKALAANAGKLGQDDFYKKLAAIMDEYASHKSYLTYTANNLRTGLSLFPEGLPQEVKEQITAFLAEQNTSRFSPKKDEIKSREKVCSELRQIIKNSERSIK